MSAWSTPGDIRVRLKREWDNGHVLAGLAGGEPVFPIRIPLKGPGTQALAEQFEQARRWIAELVASEKGAGRAGYRLEWQEIRHRQLGVNRIPLAAVVETERDGLALIGKQREADRFRELVAKIRATCPPLTTWLQKRPLRVLEHAEDWPKLLAVVDWVLRHPLPDVYIRQIDAPNVDTKFIERNRSLLCEMLDLLLPQEAVRPEFSGASGFERRYGFRSKPVPIRFRFLDPSLRIHSISDLSVTSTEFACLSLPVGRVFITENEINFLAFPEAAGSIVLFGAGYGFDPLAHAGWLQEKEIVYWGDIDTHGFAILDQLRSQFPETRSLLMDRETLLAHRSLWGKEEHPTDRELSRLQPEEVALYDDLRRNRLAPAVRLEQERIGFAWVKEALSKYSRRIA